MATAARQADAAGLSTWPGAPQNAMCARGGADNKRRIAAGLRPVRIRMGICGCYLMLAKARGTAETIVAFADDSVAH